MLSKDYLLIILMLFLLQLEVHYVGLDMYWYVSEHARVEISYMPLHE
jgi:hypothetical protein